MSDNVQINIPAPNTLVLGSAGAFSKPWWYVIQSLLKRTGGAPGVNITEVQTQVAQSQNLALYGLMDDDDVAAQASVNIAGLTALVESQGVEIALADLPDRVAVNNVLAAMGDTPELSANAISPMVALADEQDRTPPISAALFTSLAFTVEAA